MQFCLYKQTRVIWKEQIKMWLNCRFSALIQGVSQKITYSGYELHSFLYIVPYFQGWWFEAQMDNDPKDTAKATKEPPKAKKIEYSSMARSVTWTQPNSASFAHTEDKTEGRKNYKQVAAEGSCSKGISREEAFGNVHGFQTSGSHWLQRIFIQVLKVILIFIIMVVCPFDYELPKIRDYA